MTQTIREIMTSDPITMQSNMSVVAAARRMRDASIGDVLVLEGDELAGIVTDRDIVLRTVAEEKDPAKTTLGDCCTGSVDTLSPDDSVDRAIELMRDRAIRRVPVVDGKKPIGIVSLGDLAVARDAKSVLGQISAAPPKE